jgi:hypothetical protein
MSLKLNSKTVPHHLRTEIGNIAIERFPGEIVEWVERDDLIGFVVVEIPDWDYGDGMLMTQTRSMDDCVDDAGAAVSKSLDEVLLSFLRAHGEEI